MKLGLLTTDTVSVSLQLFEMLVEEGHDFAGRL